MYVDILHILYVHRHKSPINSTLYLSLSKNKKGTGLGVSKTVPAEQAA
jgi:hypothetical protein